MHVRNLEYFLAVVREGSFSRASRALGVAQPSLSQGIRSLESDLGVDLFHRVGRGVVLSAAGTALIGPATQTVRDIEQVRAVVGEVAHLGAGEFHIAAIASMAVYPLAGICARFTQRHPGVALRIFVPKGELRAVDYVLSGQCELGFSDLPIKDSRLVVKALDRERCVLASPPHHGRDDGVVSLDELVTLPVVMRPPGTPLRSQVDDALHTKGVRLDVKIEIDHLEAILPMVLAGAGHTILPEGMARSFAGAGAVVRELADPIERDVGMIYRRGPQTAALRRFLDLVDAQILTGTRRAAAR